MFSRELLLSVVCGQAEAAGAGLLCVTPTEAWSKQGVSRE